MSASDRHDDAVRKPYSGYARDTTPIIDDYLVRVGRGTPGGEFHRRYWQAIAYEHELGAVPTRVRVLGEDLVVFRDRSGRIGALHMNCCHRNASLEYGLIEERGLRCCYHGRVFDVDGTMLEIPGEPDRMKSTMTQGAYPVRTWGGIAFVYMGPMDRLPFFPTYDFMTVPGMRIVPGERWDIECNWLQMRENTMDPAHTYTLHAIPTWRGMEHFAPTFGERPTTVFTETENGFVYSASRRVGDNVWTRSAETLGPNMKRIGSLFETAETVKAYSLPFLTIWTTPADDTHSFTLFVSHVADGESMPFEKRRALEAFGQYNDRPYSERQWIPGDYDAQISQGPIASKREHLVSQDRGVIMFRRRMRHDIEVVEGGGSPSGVYLSDPGIVPTFANDRVVPASAVPGGSTDTDALAEYSAAVAQEYLVKPPLRELAGLA